MGLLNDNRAEKAKAVPGQERSRRVANPDWDGGQEAANDTSFHRTNQRAANDNYYGKPTIDQNFSQTANDDRTLRALGLGNKQKTRLNKNEEQFAAEQTASAETNKNNNAQTKSRFRNSGASQRSTLAAAAVSPLQVIARAKATAINAAALSWSFPLWLTFQLPFAIIGIVTLGIVGAIGMLTAGSGGILGWLAGAAITAVTSITGFIGIDFEKIALAIYMISYVLILAFGMFSILFLYLQYTIAGLKPLSGSHSSLKVGMLLLAVIGYSTPLANMFPFVLLWVVAVWVYPR